MRPLTEHKDQIAALDCGSEFFVFVDFTTDNLIVHDGRRGFVVTRCCLETWPPDKIASAAKDAVQDLAAGLEADRNGVKFWPLKELQGQMGKGRIG